MSQESPQTGDRESPDPEERSVLVTLRDRLEALPRLRLPREEHEPAHEPTAEGGAATVTTRSPEDPTDRTTEWVDKLYRGDHFRIVDEIARGGMGVVFRARDGDLGRDVAIKMLKEDFSEDPMVLQRFVEEAQVGGQLQHPGIVPVYELGVTADRRPFFAMKLVKGGTLEEKLKKRADPRDQRRRLLTIFESVTQTMAYAHSRRVIHRDLKPSNVMVGSFGEVLLVDWGLAKVLPREQVVADPPPKPPSGDISVIATVRHGDGDASASMSGSVMGTLSYMSPEQARGEVDSVDARTDVFALGAILCEILTGKPPYPADKERGFPMAVRGDVTQAFAALTQCGADTELVELARNCLEPERSARPKNAGVVTRRLGDWLASSELRERAAQVEAAEARAREAGERRARRLTIGLAASVLFAGILSAGFWLQTERQRTLRLRRTEEGVSDALKQASFARGRSSWSDARIAVARARTHLEAGVEDAELRARIEAEERAVEDDLRAESERLDRIARHEHFASEIEAIRSRLARTNRLKLEAYARLFADVGIDLADSSTDTVSAIRSHELGLEMAAALVDWARLLRASEKESTPEVERLLQIAIATDDDPSRLRLRRAILGGDREEILDIARDEAVLELDPMTVIVLADELWWFDERDKALRILELAELRHPDDFHLHVKLAARRMNRLEADAAFVHLKAALAREPDNAWVLASLGLLYLQEGDVERALAVSRRATAAHPEDAYAQHYLGAALEARGETEAAVACYRLAVDLEPEYVIALRRLGYALDELGRHGEALDCFLEAVELDPDHPRVLNSVAWRLATIEDQARRDPELALFFAERCIALVPRDPDYQSTLAVCLYRNRRYEETIAAAVEAQDLSRGLTRGPAEIFFAAMAAARLGADDEARAWFERGERWLSTNRPTAELTRLRDEARAVLGAR